MTSPKRTYIAVYGTLRLGQRAWERYLKDSTFIGTFRMEGNLFNLGAFPGVKLPLENGHNNTGVTVDVFEIDHPVLDHLDRYEGVPSLYSRRTIHIEDMPCFVYEYNGIPSEGSLIESGDWFNRSH